MGSHFPVEVGFDQFTGGYGRIKGNILVIPQVAISLELDDFAFVGECAVKGLRFFSSVPF